MDISQLSLLVEVSHAGSFAEVARRHERDPSLISRAIASLESELGLRLFHRSTRQLKLTEAGKRYVKHIEVVLEQLEQAEDEAKQVAHRPSGTLRMTASTAFGQICLLPLLEKFQTDFPEIQLDLKFTDTNLDLLSEDIDLACRLTPAFDSEYVGVKLFNTHYHVVASPRYLDRKQAPKSPTDLSMHQCIVFSLPNYRSQWLFKNKNGKIEKIAIRSALAISNAMAIRESARQGLGPALLANWMVKQDIKDGRLVDLFPNHQVTATDFETAAWLLYPSRTHLPMKTRAMVDYLKAYFVDNVLDSHKRS